MATDNAIQLYKNAGTIVHDAVKTLRTNIQFSSVDRPIKSIVLTSVVPHDGKSTLAIFLGIAMVESGLHTLLVECDCRRPMLQNYLKLRPQYGLMDVLRRQVRPQEAVYATDIPKLHVLTSSVLANPVEILGSERFQQVIEEFKEAYDVILLDTPPLGSFIEAAILASRADGTVLVLQSGSSDIAATQSVVAQLEKAKAHVLGVVLNGVEMPGSDYYYSDYYYRGEKKRHRKKAESFRQGTHASKHRRSATSSRPEQAVRTAAPNSAARSPQQSATAGPKGQE